MLRLRRDRHQAAEHESSMAGRVVSHLIALAIAAWLLIDGFGTGPDWQIAAGAFLLVAVAVEFAIGLRREIRRRQYGP